MDFRYLTDIILYDSYMQIKQILVITSLDSPAAAGLTQSLALQTENWTTSLLCMKRKNRLTRLSEVMINRQPLSDLVLLSGLVLALDSTSNAMEN